MRLAVLFALAGCNQVFGLNDTDPYMKAPPRCPPIGTAPTFSEEVHQGIRQPCVSFSASSDNEAAMASCVVPMGGLPFPPAYGALDGPLATFDLPLGDPADVRDWGPVLAPEGDEAFAIYTNTNHVGSIALAAYRLEPDGSWAFNGYQPTPSAAPITNMSPPTRRPQRHAVYYLNGQLHEAIQDATGAWTEITPPYDGYPVGAVRPYLSPDGLRMMTVVNLPGGGHATYYGDRATLDDRFGAPTVLDEVPAIGDLFMTADCGRVYFSGLDNVLYEAQP